MTSDREEQLITDVAWIKGKLENYFEQVSPTLATKESVEAVDARLTSHIENHKDTRAIWPVWTGIAASSLLSAFALWRNGGH